MISSSDIFRASLLIVDDQQANVALLEEMLRDAGYGTIASTLDPYAVCALHRQHRYDLILLDLQMPGLDGFQVMEGLKEIETSGYLPVLVITAQPGHKLRALRAGAKDFVSKPFDLPEILIRVRNLLEARLLNAELERRVQTISELQRAEEHAHNRQTLALDQHAIVTATDVRGTITHANDKFCAISQYSREELLGQNHRMLKSGQHPPEFFVEMYRTIAHGQTWRGEICNRAKDGSLYWVDSTIVPMPGPDGKPTAYTAIRIDITARKRADEELLKAKEVAEAATSAKSDFLAIMSHEIRTPLNGVIGMSNLLAETELDLKQRRYADAIQSSAGLLLTLINDILDFSKIEARCLTFEILDFDLRQTMRDTIESLAERGRAKQLVVTGRVDDDVPTWLRGDPGRLRQILTNLVSNSIKFTETGEVAVHVAASGETATTVDLNFSVKDTGIGIAPEAQARLFQAFSQANTSTTRKYGGTGLGLAISRLLVEMMHGEIGVVSAVGQGSTFHFRVRLDKQTEATGNPFARPAAFATASVLVVETDPARRHLVAEKLQSWGLDVDSAGGAFEAMRALRQRRASDRPFTLAIIAAELPFMDGIALAGAIANDAAIASTRTLLLASDARALAPAMLQTARVVGVVTLPLQPSRLFTCVRDALADPSPHSAGRNAQAVVDRPGPRARILIAEDNVINQEVALEYLEKLGYRADVVAHGLEAVEALGRIPYDLVFMDCMMPEMDGYEAATRVRELERAGERGFGGRPPVHIVAMTANAMAGDREKCLAAGMNDYVSKPVSAADLRRAIMRWSAASGATVGADRAAYVAPASSAPAEARPDAALVNLRRMGDVVSHQPEKLRRMIGMYVEQADQMLESLRTAVGDGAVDAVRHAAHRWGGSSATFGVVAVVPALNELERLARAGTLDHAKALLGETERQWQLARAFLQAHLQTLSALKPTETHDQTPAR